jgi:hypothetical protein
MPLIRCPHCSAAPEALCVQMRGHPGIRAVLMLRFDPGYVQLIALVRQYR